MYAPVVEEQLLERLVALIRCYPDGDAVEWWLLERQAQLARALGDDVVAELVAIDFLAYGWLARLSQVVVRHPQVRAIATRPHPTAARFAAEVPVLTEVLASSMSAGTTTGFPEVGLVLQLAALGGAWTEWLGPQARADIAAYDDFCGRVARDGRERR